MARQINNVEEAISAVEAAGGYVFDDRAHPGRYVWQIRCPAWFGRLQYGCSSNASLIEVVQGCLAEEEG